MLTELDDTLWHQLPTTFDHAGTSDPRFFDRYWFAVYEPAGDAAVQVTLGAYRNMNVVDGGVVAVHRGRQHNLRVSRSLRPRFEPACGPLSVEVVEPLWRFALRVAPGPQPVHGELHWHGVSAPEEEPPHFERVRGRVAQDYRRFDQVGECSGWLQVGEHRLDVDRWWACRDHSWGVRPGIGIPEPVTGPPPPAEAGTLFAFLFFSTDVLAGHLQVAERGEHRSYLSGQLRDRRDPTAPVRRVVDAALSLEVHPGTRRFHRVVAEVDIDDGRRLELCSDAVGPSIAMAGLGYSGGYDDGRGLGAWRGEDHLEHDVWDVSDPAVVVAADGTPTTPVHRIQPVGVRASGSGFDSAGTGSMTLIANGHLPRYGLA